MPQDTPTRSRRPLAVLAIYLAAIVIALAIGQLPPAGGAKSIAYSDFRTDLTAGRVATVVVDAERIRGTWKTGGTFVTVRVQDPSLVETLERHGVEITAKPPAGPWSSLRGWLLPVLTFLVIWSALGRAAARGRGVSAFGRSRARIYAEDGVGVSFDDVAGIDEAVEELREIVDFLRNPGKYTQLGGRIPKGVLLVGPPGTGKTLLARAVAGQAGVPFFSLTGSEFVELFVGVGAARVRDLFAQAEERAPCIIFIDELDALGKTRGASVVTLHEEREQTLNQLLAEMDGFDPRKGIIVMAATNRPEVLDPALLRAGRFDRQVLVDRPDVKGREAILRIHARQVKLAPDVNLDVVAARTAGFVGADLANLVNEATLLAARNDRTEVGAQDFDEAIERLVAGLKRKRAMSDRERRIVAWHEAGHAIVASLLPGVDPVHKVSIVQRGAEPLGHTLQLPIQDRFMQTEPELRARLAVLLAGRAAEALATGDVSTAAHDDLRHATDLARAMVVEYGMSSALGPISYADVSRPRFLEAPGAGRRACAERTAAAIDAEMQRVIADALSEARRRLESHRGALDTLARWLVDREVVDGAEVRALVGAGKVAGDGVAA